MPIYEYSCKGCGDSFSVLKYSRTESTVCPSCGSSDVTKLLSAFSYSGGDFSGGSYYGASGGGGG